ncbi:hypothetical protein Tco_0730756, partial [Tanacetum coccineum]
MISVWPPHKKVDLEDESDIEGVSETVFGDQDDPLVQEL